MRARFFWAFINRAGAYRASRRFQLALNDIEIAKRLKASMPVFFHLGRTLHDMGHYDRAIEAFSSGLPYQPDYALAYHRRGLSYEAKGNLQRALQDFKTAEPLYKRALAISEKALGLAHPDVAMGLNILALLYHHQGKYAEAEPLHKRSLAILDKALGPEHPDVAQILESYAALLRKTERSGEATMMEARAKAIRAKHAKENPAK